MNNKQTILAITGSDGTGGSGIQADICIPIASIDGHIVAARQGNQLATAFHPELDCDPRIHQFFLEKAK